MIRFLVVVFRFSAAMVDDHAVLNQSAFVYFLNN